MNPRQLQEPMAPNNGNHATFLEYVNFLQLLLDQQPQILLSEEQFQYLKTQGPGVGHTLRIVKVPKDIVPVRPDMPVDPRPECLNLYRQVAPDINSQATPGPRPKMYGKKQPMKAAHQPIAGCSNRKKQQQASAVAPYSRSQEPFIGPQRYQNPAQYRHPYIPRAVIYGNSFLSVIQPRYPIRPHYPTSNRQTHSLPQPAPFPAQNFSNYQASSNMSIQDDPVF